MYETGEVSDVLKSIKMIGGEKTTKSETQLIQARQDTENQVT